MGALRLIEVDLTTCGAMNGTPTNKIQITFLSISNQSENKYLRKGFIKIYVSSLLLNQFDKFSLTADKYLAYIVSLQFEI